MVNVRQDRVPDPTLSRASTPSPDGPAGNGRGAQPHTIVLALRLRMQDSGGYPADVSWAADSTAAALAIDVISASGGAPDPAQGALLPVRFMNLQSALLAARRLQWALDGLAENAGERRVTASMAIHLFQDPSPAAVAATLENLMPGRVLVNRSVAEEVQNLPGASVRETSEAEWRELRWQRPGAAVGFSDDEQAVLSLISALGRQDPCPPRPTPVVPPAAPVAREYQAPEALGRSVLEPEPAAGSGKMKWLILGGAAAIVIAFAALLISGIVSGNHGKTPAPPPDTPAKTIPPAGPVTPAPTNPTGPVANQKPKQPVKPGKQPRVESKVDQPPPKITGSCDLTDADIPRSLDRARKYMYDGNLEAAEAMFQRLLPCPVAHEKAQEGLQSVRQRKAAQSP